MCHTEVKRENVYGQRAQIMAEHESASTKSIGMADNGQRCQLAENFRQKILRRERMQCQEYEGTSIW